MTTLPLGTSFLGDGRTLFNVWAPDADKIEARVVTPEERYFQLERDEWGYHHKLVEGIDPGANYFYRIDGGRERPDPASKFQPQGVHGPSEVTNPNFDWSDEGWYGIPLKDYIVYELHVGTFTTEGTFEAIILYLDCLKNLGITAVELMPVAQFPGTRNWGYDGVYPYAVQDSYGGVHGLKTLVNACHQRGLALILDVVYNHLGPEGNFMSDFGPYFTKRYRTPWGAALNFDGPHSDEVKRFFIENALYWLKEFHVDAFRLDAVHAILDHSPQPFVEKLAMAVKESAERLNRRAYLIAESDANDARLITSRELGGYGMDAQWNDDFHHCVHALLTGEKQGYYQDYGGEERLAKAHREGFVYSGQHSLYRKRRHGTSSRHLPGERFVVCSQNHDQIGNRMLGERLSQLVSFEQLKLAAGLVLLSPNIPLLFMGEEYGEVAPFQYFISHTDAELVEAVRNGRIEEFAAFQTRQGRPPDPQDEATFDGCKLNHGLKETGRHSVLLNFYKELIRLRQETPALANFDKRSIDVQANEKSRSLFVRRSFDDNEIAVIFHTEQDVGNVRVGLTAGRWHKRLDSVQERWGGTGPELPASIESDGEVELKMPAHSFVMFEREIISD